MDTGKLRWFVQWNPDYKGWEVMLGGFRDSWDTNKYLAEQRRDELNWEDDKLKELQKWSEQSTK